MICSDACAKEREHRRCEADKERIAAQRREYYQRKLAEIKAERLRRFNSS